MKKLLLLLFLILSGYDIYPCSCGGNYDAEYFEKQKAWADFIFIGEAIENVGPYYQRNNQLDEEKIGHNVLFKVDSVIKGDIKRDMVIIDQWNSGSCTQTFHFGDKYIVFGIDYKKHWDYEETIKNDQDFKRSEGYVELTQFDFYASQEADYSIINTSLCSAFSKKDSILRYLK